MANDTFELFSLTSKLDLDTSSFDRAYNQTRPKMITLSQDLKKIETGGRSLGGNITRELRPAFSGLQASITGLGGPLDSTIGRYSSLLSVGSKLSLSTAGIGLGFGILAAGGIAAAAGMFELVKRAADAGDEIFDLTQKVNFSAESISTLKNEGQLAGVEFQAISAGLGIFNKNVEAAQDGNKKLANTFKVLKIDLGNNETALRSTFKALLAVEDEQQQGALAMQIFGRGGKELLGIIHSLNGDIDAATEKFRKMGALITTDAANAANEFSDKLKMLEMRLDGVTRSIGQKLMPTALDALEKLDNALDENSHHASTWADALVSATQFAAEQIKHILEGLAIVIEGFQKTFGEGSLVQDTVGRMAAGRKDDFYHELKAKGILAPDIVVNPNQEPEGEYAIAGGYGSHSVGSDGRPAGVPKKGARIDFGGGGGGGGKGEDRAKIAQQVAKLQLDATLAGLKAEQDANKRSLDLRRKDFDAYATRYLAIENRRHQAVLDGLEAETRALLGMNKERVKGLIEPGNIDLFNRPSVRNSDGSISTVRSMSTNLGGREVLMPTVSDSGRLMTTEQAIQQYLSTGKHLGIFRDAASATAYAKQLHEEQAKLYTDKSSSKTSVQLLELRNRRTEEATEHERNRNVILDERARILDQIEAFLRDQDRTVDSLTAGTNQWDDAYQQLVDTLKEEGVALEENMRLRVEGNIARARELQLILSVTRARRVSESTRERVVTKAERERPPWIDLGGGSTVGGEPDTTERPRVATVEQQVMRERAAILREQMDNLASDLTWTIDDAISEGFRSGVKAGVIQFGLGILEMARHEALQELARAISKALGGTGGQGQSGGGILSTLLGFGVRALGGLFGGGAAGGIGGAAGGTIGKFATGGYMAPDSWAIVGERGPELVKAGSRGVSVMNNGESLAMAGGGGMTVIQNIHVPSMYQAGNRQTQTQAMRGLQQAAQRGYSLRG